MPHATRKRRSHVGGSTDVVSPLASWFADRRAVTAAARCLGNEPILFPAADRAWVRLVPGFAEVLRLASAGLPFHIAAERRYDRAGRLGRLRPALRAGKTVFFPQIHQVLPRVMRLIVALRVPFFGPGREECSFLFLVDGVGREGLGLHHDGEVHSFWLQLAGRRTVTLGPPVVPGTPQDLRDRDERATSFGTRALPPGSLLYLPPRTPHRVVCHEPSMALSLTWSVARRRGPRWTALAWDVASGYVRARPPASRTRVWTQIPTAFEEGSGHAWTALRLPGGTRLRVPPSTRRFAADLAVMAAFSRGALGDALRALEAHGIVGPQDLPLVVVPDAPKALDGWRFA